MRRLLAALLSLAMTSSAAALEVWLASTDECTTCSLYERAAQMRGYGRALRYADRGGLEIPILAVNKNVLAADVLEQLPPDRGPDSPFWPYTLTVLVMDVDRVAFAGNIEESADNTRLVIPEALMFPPDRPEHDDPAVRGMNVYGEFFTREWNLEYFVDVALGKQPERAPAKLVDLASPEPVALASRNVVLWGAAPAPIDNALFIPARINEIRAAVAGIAPAATRFVTLFGHGPDVPGNDTSVLDGNRVVFRRADVAADYGADAASLNRVLTGVLEARGARTLLVQVGHGGQTGAPLWGHGLTVTPADLEPLRREAAGETVLVSGACHSGQFAFAAQCGFFAAHPDVLAAGCQLSPEALAKSDDYLRHFFRAATGGAEVGPARRSRRGASLPTLYDAHWYAAVRLEDHQLPYTTTDALIDRFFAEHPERLPAAMTVAEIRTAASALSPAEIEAAAALTAGLAPDLSIPLTGHVEANHAADKRLVDATETSSAERNAIAALPYKLATVLLARRLAYAAANPSEPEFALAAACEQRSIQEFLGPARRR